MKERPILFNGAMVRALLEGSKTQTRRVVKQLDPEKGAVTTGNDGTPMGVCWAYGGSVIYCPYGRPGDRLWVRETFAYLGTNKRGPHAYRADTYDGERIRVDAPWKPSIHMPRAASRILLEIVSVRVERLQDISAADAKAEGIEPHEVRQFAIYGATPAERAAIYRDAAVGPYQRLWRQINGAGSWDANPWVWVVEFKRVHP